MTVPIHRRRRWMGTVIVYLFASAYFKFALKNSAIFSNR